jgi:Cu+-exporting ATPase
MDPGQHTRRQNETTPPSVTELVVTGMNCSNCARHVTEALQGVAGVAEARVRLEEGRATVRWLPETEPRVESVTSAVQAAGYAARVADESTGPAQPAGPSPLATWRFSVIFGAALTLPLVLGEWVFGWGLRPGFQWFGFALATPVLAVCGGRFYRGAWAQLRQGRANMDTLVSLGATTAYAYSCWAVLAGWPGHVYFMEAAAIITLISLGHWLEALASAKAANSLRALMQLAPQTARLLRPDGREEEVAVAALKPGDCVVLKPGDRVPTDGVVTEGGSAVDESMLTGESVPVDKQPGHRLYAGTLNQDGRLILRVTATGRATALAHIIAVVQRAQASRAGIQRLGDQVSSVFVPVVVCGAVATGLWWGLAYDHALRVSQSLAPWLWHAPLPSTALAAAFVHASAVLIVACPCAMGLATPAAIMAGTNAAARRGILIRDGVALEKSGRLTALLFDKTGTLTRGKLAVAAVQGQGARDPADAWLKRAVAELAGPSSHPLSGALALWAADAHGAPAENAAAALDAGLADWREVRGSGVQASRGDATLRLGSLAWLADCQVDLRPGDEFVGAWGPRGASILGLAQDQALVALFALRDELKPQAAEVVGHLAGLGLRTYLITGDHRPTALAVAAQAGIPAAQVFAEIRPERKAEIVAQLQARGERVALVGDGMNDAPALEQADLGIAVSQASDVAREAADIILLKADIAAIPEALGLAHATLRTIRQNLFWAFFYNAAAVPLAALGFLSPVLCALAMGASDLLVIGNALRLRRWRP